MARRKLSMQGRIVAAGLSVGIAGALAGFMAAGDHNAGATQPASSVSPAGADGSSSSATPTPYDRNDSGAATNASPQSAPQPQTSTGGS
jgi:hypothetical protein